MRHLEFLIIALIFIAALPGSGASDQAEDIIRKMDYQLRGVESSYGEFTMIVSKPRWKNPRVMKMKSWETRKTEKQPGRSFILITEPAKESGKAFLKIGNQMWAYFPDVNTTTKIPQSMMFEGWMGSDFSHGDLMHEGNILNDYFCKIINRRMEAGQSIVAIELIPKPEALETWGKIMIELRESDSIPLKEEFYNEKGKLVRTMIFEDIKDFGGKTLPAKWMVKSADKPMESTTLLIETIQFNLKIGDDIFTMENLKRGGK